MSKLSNVGWLEKSDVILALGADDWTQVESAFAGKDRNAIIDDIAGTYLPDANPNDQLKVALAIYRLIQ